MWRCWAHEEDGALVLSAPGTQRPVLERISLGKTGNLSWAAHLSSDWGGTVGPGRKSICRAAKAYAPAANAYAPAING